MAATIVLDNAEVGETLTLFLLTPGTDVAPVNGAGTAMSAGATRTHRYSASIDPAALSIVDGTILAVRVTDAGGGLYASGWVTVTNGQTCLIRDARYDDKVASVMDKVDTSLEADGAVYRFTTNALEQAPSGGGGGTTLVVAPVVGVVTERTVGAVVSLYVGEIRRSFIAVVDDNGDAFDLSGKTLELVIENAARQDVQIIENGDLEIAGDGNNVIWFTNSSEVTSKERELILSVWDLTDFPDREEVLITGKMPVTYAARNDG